MSGPDERLRPFVRTYCGYTDSAGSLRRELPMFLLLSAVGLAIALACLGFSHYVLGYTSTLADRRVRPPGRRSRRS